ncbi:NIPSNAP family protein [Roseateles sp.]|uniref:NIPSNAP family protein n=1 Tax=Roseateles sp. TaxID=1971397 RepID=UPI0031D71189
MADDHPIYELRQYKIAKGQRERFMRLFDEAFVDSQEAVGMRLYGQFADLDDQDRFVWIRGFDDMASRQRALTEFYTGPVWQARRGEANPLLVDNDNSCCCVAPAARRRPHASTSHAKPAARRPAARRD